MNMKKMTDKRAFFTIDVESFADTDCVHKAEQPISQTMLDGLDKYMEILDRHNIKATLFVICDLVPKLEDKLKKYITNGHKIAIHGKQHIPPRFLTDEQFEEQIADAKNTLESMFGVPVVGHRAPCFSLDRNKLDILKKLGFSYDSSKMDFSLAIHREYMDVEDFESLGSGVYRKDDFYEFGVSVQKLFFASFPVSGGGYIRIPVWFFAWNLLRRYLKHNKNYIFYSHPFEFSAEKTPRLKKLGFFERFYLIAGKHSYPYKLEYIIKKLKRYGYSFCTFEDVCQGR